MFGTNKNGFFITAFALAISVNVSAGEQPEKQVKMPLQVQQNFKMMKKIKVSEDQVVLNIVNKSEGTMAYVEIISNEVYDVVPVAAQSNYLEVLNKGDYVKTLRATGSTNPTLNAYCPPVSMNSNKTAYMNLETHNCYIQ